VRTIFNGGSVQALDQLACLVPYHNPSVNVIASLSRDKPKLFTPLMVESHY
jgi:hypothetical protein